MVAAFVQVEERLACAGLKPAMLNLHDEDLDKREFLRQAIEKFPALQNAPNYPFGQLKESRKKLNERVRFGRQTAHPSLQVTKREAMAGLIQLRKELKQVPRIDIAGWQSLSKERFTKLQAGMGEWSDFAAVLTDKKNVWNQVRVEAFDQNPNAVNELQSTIKIIQEQLESLQTVREWAAAVGIELPLNSDDHVKDMLKLVTNVLAKPACHPQLVGNPQITQAELDYLKSQWERREMLMAARHPVIFTDKIADDAIKTAIETGERIARELLKKENAKTWEDLSLRASYHAGRYIEIEASEQAYRRLCALMGIEYSPLLNVRRAQLQTVISLASFGVTIPRMWWKAETSPVLSVSGWKAHLQACAHHAKYSPLPLDYIALERVATTHWKYLEAKAEHGFNLVSYCLHYVNDRKCKYALCQIYPSIPPRGFKAWQKITLHAIKALGVVQALRSSAEIHVILKQLTSDFLLAAFEDSNNLEKYLLRKEVQDLEKVAGLVEAIKTRNDLFNIATDPWQTFWELTNANLLDSAKVSIAEHDSLNLPATQPPGHIQEALKFHALSQQEITKFLHDYEQKEGNRSNTVLAGFAAQREFADCQQKLLPLAKYLAIQNAGYSRIGNG
jgi:hypothetical protein